MVQLSHLYMTTGKTVALTRRTFDGKAVSLPFNILFRLTITFLPRSKHFLISWLQSQSAVILEPKKIKLVTVSTFHYFPIYFLLFPFCPHLSGEIMVWIKHKLESRLPGEISMTSDVQMTPPYGRKQRGTTEPLNESERGE